MNPELSIPIHILLRLDNKEKSFGHSGTKIKVSFKGKIKSNIHTHSLGQLGKHIEDN